MRTGIKLAIFCLTVSLLVQTSLSFIGEDLNKYTVILLKTLEDSLPANSEVAQRAFTDSCSVYTDGVSCSKQIPEDASLTQATTKLACIVNNGEGIKFFSFTGQDALWTHFTTGASSGLTGNVLETVCDEDQLDQYSELMIGVLIDEENDKSAEFEASFVSNSQTQGAHAFDVTFSSTMIANTKHQVEVEYQVPAAYSQVKIVPIMEVENTVQGQQYWNGLDEEWFCSGSEADGLDHKDPAFGSTQKFILEIEQDVLDGTYNIPYRTFNEGTSNEYKAGVVALKVRYIDCRTDKILAVLAANYNIRVDGIVDLTITARTDRVQKQIGDLDIDVFIPSTFFWCDEPTCASPFFFGSTPREGIVGQTLYAVIISQTVVRTLELSTAEVFDEDNNQVAGFANISTASSGEQGRLILTIELLSVFDVATVTFNGLLVLPDGRLLAEEEEEVQGTVANGQFSALVATEDPDEEDDDDEEEEEEPPTDPVTSGGATNLLATGVTLLYLVLSLF